MNRSEWRNIYCILHSLDAYEIKIPEDTPTEFDWSAFRDSPHQYLLQCSDGVAELIWKAVEKRMPKQNIQIGEHVQFDKEVEERFLELSEKIHKAGGLGNDASLEDHKQFTNNLLNQARQYVIEKRKSKKVETEWQPIETAPKDMSILLYDPLYWRIDVGERSSIGEGKWLHYHERWTLFRNSKASTSPTHWMPLPEPPKE